MRAILECHSAHSAFAAAGECAKQASAWRRACNAIVHGSPTKPDRESPAGPGAAGLRQRLARGGASGVSTELGNARVVASRKPVGIRTSASELTGKNAGIPTTTHDAGPKLARTAQFHGTRAHRFGSCLQIRLRTAVCFMGVAWLGNAIASMPPITSTASGDIQVAAEQAVREHFGMPGDRIEVAAMALDSRLRLGSCGVPLNASVSQFAKPTSLVTALVQCPQPGSWSVRVPVKMQLFRGVLVSTRTLLRGDGLRATDLRIEQRDVTRLGYGYIDNMGQITGRTLSRELRANSVLTPEALGGRRMIRAGDHVEMIARLDGIVVRANGIALGSGDSGARLLVRNVNSGKVVDGIVTAPGKVATLP